MVWKFKPSATKHFYQHPGDDPSADGTDYAHPAYWRGEDMGVYGTVQRIFAVLTDGDKGGVTGSPELNRARLLIQNLKVLAYQAVEALQWCSGSQDFAPEGTARQGWVKCCEPVLRKYIRMDTSLCILKTALNEKKNKSSAGRIGNHSSRRQRRRM